MLGGSFGGVDPVAGVAGVAGVVDGDAVRAGVLALVEVADESAEAVAHPAATTSIAISGAQDRARRRPTSEVLPCSTPQKR